ncbi:cytochrome P450 87A3-like [Telopea speciosissima]|uniref:cytochrome P450 87A3-like n=1 Tax=Telopea speciosissima TaxID=54955 RepID=UPI001CC77136|nr:cytochrome P450 87A3-like [Telopea speciosissima]
MWSVALFGVSLVVIYIVHWVYRWSNPKCNGILPPGSMGFPLIGETLQYFIPTPSIDIQPFIKKRMDRYGALFKTSLVGRPVVISTDPEINQFIFQQEGKLFQIWYMDTFTEIFGEESLISVHGFVHKYLRSLILSIFGSENLKEKLLPAMEQQTIKHLKFWTSQDSIELKYGISSMIFELVAKKLISYDEEISSKKLLESFMIFIRGLISFPLNVPGTTYYKCLQGQKKIMKMLKELLDERVASPEKQHGDFFDIIIKEIKKEGSLLSERIALHLLFTLLFASYETTSEVLAFGMKMLEEHPQVLEELTKEHEEIIRNRKDKDSGITWKEYKSMTFTSMVINEMVRLANIAPGIFRKATADVEINGKFKIFLMQIEICVGYIIPAGWAVMVCAPVVHLNPKKYDDPVAFNPRRWENMETNAGSKNFIAFGGGSRFCVGAEFAKLQIAIFLHYLITGYRWKTIKGGNLVRCPGLAFPNGIYIKLSEKQKSIISNN